MHQHSYLRGSIPFPPGRKLRQFRLPCAGRQIDAVCAYVSLQLDQPAFQSQRVSRSPHENLVDVSILKGCHQFGGKMTLVSKGWHKCQALVGKEKCACSSTVSENTRFSLVSQERPEITKRTKRSANRVEIEPSKCVSSDSFASPPYMHLRAHMGMY